MDKVVGACPEGGVCWERETARLVRRQGWGAMCAEPHPCRKERKGRWREIAREGRGRARPRSQRVPATSPSRLQKEKVKPGEAIFVSAWRKYSRQMRLTPGERPIPVSARRRSSSHPMTQMCRRRDEVQKCPAQVPARSSCFPKTHFRQSGTLQHSNVGERRKQMSLPP